MEDSKFKYFKKNTIDCFGAFKTCLTNGMYAYAETYPVLIKPLKVNRPEKMISNQKALHEYLKELVNDESVLRSVRMAMRQGEKKKKGN